MGEVNYSQLAEAQLKTFSQEIIPLLQTENKLIKRIYSFNCLR